MTRHKHASDARYLLTRVSRAIHAAEQGHGLRAAQWQALRYLSRANRYSRHPALIADYLHATRSPISQIINRLVTYGLIEREADPSDGRRVRLSLTIKGRQTLENDPQQALVPAIAALPDQTRRNLEDGLTALLTEMERVSDKRSLGVCETCTSSCQTVPRMSPAARTAAGSRASRSIRTDSVVMCRA